GEEDLSGITLKLPEGLLANLNGVKLCEEAQAAEGSCPAESKVGSASVSAGAGSEPLSLAGSVYLTKAYGGGPLGLAIAIPASVGPYNAGTVVVRAAVIVDTVDGQITIKTDPLPQVVDGLPLRLRNLKVEISRSGFMVNPSTCSAPLSLAGTLASSGGQGSSFTDALQLEGCKTLAFDPSFTVTPSQAAIESALPLEIALALPSGDSTLHQATVALPEGVSINPSVASGLEGCSDQQLHLGEDVPVACPPASQIGSVKITSPLLPEALTGAIYIGAPLSSSPESGEEYRLFVAAESPNYGIPLRLIGRLAANTSSGRLTATFAETPPIPFTEMRLSFNGGAHAPLASPSTCGSAQLASSLIATSGASAAPGAAIAISANGEGEGCPASLPFAPALSLTPSSAAAGAPDALALSVEGSDRQQKLGALETTLPPGLLGEIANVALCGEPEAGQGTCPGASEVGTASAIVGIGSEPLQLSGPVYLTGPYGGAPFGLSIAIPAAAGPYNLGTVVVRAAISVNPQSAQLTIKSSSFPTILGGIPLRLKGVRISLQRPSFIVNPTSCAALTLSALVTSAAGAQSAASSPFQASGCQSLAFAPTISASTQSPSSRTEGAGLETVITYPSEGEANLASVGVSLPAQLVARTSTLGDACPEATFEANPESCPAAARVGSASVLTPVLPGTLAGPAYLVSDGAAFPALDLVLSADGVRIILHGATAIHAGTTSASFSGLPDVPIKRFDLVLPAGPTSLLAANGSLCSGALQMPATLSAQSGAQLARQVAIAVAGCAPGSGTEGEGATASGRSPLAHLTITPTHFAAQTPAAERSAHRRALHVGARIAWSDAHAASTLFHIERLVAGVKHGRSCIAVKGTLRRPGARGGRRGRPCVVRVPVSVQQTVRGIRHGKRCVLARRGAQGARCILRRVVSSFVHRDRAGSNSMPFTGLLGGRPLAPGAYLLIAETSVPGSRRNARATAKFWIVRG
ncbi:MAG TPA: hypothetical protein VKU89_03550, partial [Solirubrobacteraceae bacterium]|nr:hypothetical protein [Solirubrobacteraceae bacterium]